MNGWVCYRLWCNMSTAKFVVWENAPSAGAGLPPPPKHTPLPQPPSTTKCNAIQHTHACMHCAYCGMGRSCGCGLQHKLGCSVPTLHPLLFTQPGHAATTLNLIWPQTPCTLSNPLPDSSMLMLGIVAPPACLCRANQTGAAWHNHCHGGFVKHKCPNKPKLQG